MDINVFNWPCKILYYINILNLFVKTSTGLKKFSFKLYSVWAEGNGKNNCNQLFETSQWFYFSVSTIQFQSIGIWKINELGIVFTIPIVKNWNCKISINWLFILSIN